MENELNIVDELELIFEDEAGIYLPQVVADENKRKANENERIANENERIANEEKRKANEISRNAKLDEYEKEVEALIEDLTSDLKKVTYMKEYKNVYVTETDNENVFVLPEEYRDTAIVKVYVNGMKLNVNEYTIDLDNLTVILTNPLDVIGTVVEVVVLKFTTALIEDYDKLKGESGYTPQRGIDYWTTDDMTAIYAYCDNYIDSQFSATLDEINGEVV